MNNAISKTLILILMSLLFSCGSDESKEVEPVVEPIAEESTNETTAKDNKITSISPLSQHFIEINFDNPVNDKSFSLDNISIISGAGQLLEPINLSFYQNGEGVIIETAPQDPVLYTLTISDPVTSPVSKKSLVTSSLKAEFTDADNFMGSTGPEPFVLYVTALSNTTVLVTMDKDMDPEFANLISAYRITSPNNSTPNIEEGRIEVISAEVDLKDKRFITLTTTSMSNIEYVLEITNVVTNNGHHLIHPDRNGGSFFGIAAQDTTAPLLLNAQSTSNTSVVATFSEPLWDNASDPVHYDICAVAFDAQGSCPTNQRLGIISSELTGKNTQISFVTQPQASGINYYLLVTGITDRATPAPGNLIAENTVAQFIGSGLDNPFIANSIAIDNTHVLVTFSERMSDDAIDFTKYKIENPALDVINAVFGNDKWHVILTTTPQERIDYYLTASDVHSAEGLLIKSPTESSMFVGYSSKDTDKPFLIASIAETSNRIRLYFSEPMADNAESPNLYQITFCPEFQTCSANTLSQLPVLSAALTASDTQVILTVENIAPRVLHQVRVSEQVTDQAMPIPHNGMDPNLSTGSFGLLLADKQSPSVVAFTYTSTNSITLTFDEEVNTGAANPLFYRICTQAFDANNACSGDTLQVLGAELNESHTQVKLTTEPFTDNTTYYVLITEGVTDTSGNIIRADANSIYKFYEGATSVADPSKAPKVIGAISTSNTTVSVSFSSIMGESALNPSNYSFVQENVNSEVGTVFSMAVAWTDATHTSVYVTTTSQNEVTYRVIVVNVKDQQGNPLATQESTLNPNYDPRTAVFAGSPAVAQQLLLTQGNFELIELGDNDVIGAGDAIVIDSQQFVLVDYDLDGVVDNWSDANDNGVIDAGDTISGLIDSDADGLSDNTELMGTVVVIELANGQTVTREVTSDPSRADTDQDGMTDLEEWAFGMNPRSPDTDNDGLSDYLEWNVIYSGPMDQDTDDDDLADGAEHNFFLTSPLLADTDGDQFSDSDELVDLNRDPKVADMPELAIEVDGINLQIDERYTYVNSEGETVSQESSTSTSLGTSQNTSFANSYSSFDEDTSSFNWNVGFGIRDAQADDSSIKTFANIGWSFLSRFFLEVGLGGTRENHWGNSSQVDSASVKESQQALEKSMVKFNEQAKEQEVTRELVAASISANINVKNQGDIAFTVKNLEVSVQQIDPQNTSKLIPIATLVAESTLITGNDLVINVGPFDTSKGPFVFTNKDVYPQVIETLMRNPQSLIFKVVNYDIEDEYERNFAYGSQSIHDRTAGISFDFGELGSENHQVATNGVLENGRYLGGFDDTGKQKGLPLGYLLEKGLGIAKQDVSQNYIAAGPDAVLSSVVADDDELDAANNIITAGADGVLTTPVALGDLLLNDNVKTGIIAGVNKRVDTRAQGDDVQLVPFGATGVAARTLVIDPGANGILDSIQANGDEQEFVSGYELQRTCAVTAPADNGNTQVGQFCSVSTADCSCTGPAGLVRVNTFRNGDYGASWFVRLEGDLASPVDFDQITLKAGQSINIGFKQDLDKDGLFAYEEYLFGSVDSAVDHYDNSEFTPIVINNQYFKKPVEELKYLADGDNFADSMDTDRDGISDYVEAKIGWLISRNGELKRVYSSPATPDSDNDGLWDIQEQDLRAFCQPNDPRSDALCTGQVVAQSQASAIIVGVNGKLDTTTSGDDVYAFVAPTSPLNQGLMFSLVGILPGDDGVIDSVLAGDDEYSNSSLVLPATDPLLSDTDGDRMSDGDELFGYAAGMAIIEGAETECYDFTATLGVKSCNAGAKTWGIVDTTAQGDDIQVIYPGSRTQAGDIIITAGANGILDTQPQGNDKTVDKWFIAIGPDRELNTQAVSGDIAIDLNYTQLSPYAPAIWNASGTLVGNYQSSVVEPWADAVSGKDIKVYGHVVTTDPLRRDTDNDAIPDGFEVAIGADPTVDDGDQFRDTDFDGLSDMLEARGWLVSVNNAAPILVKSSSVIADSDFDGLPDFVERDIGTNPNLSDTDNDGIDDYDEFRSLTRTALNGKQYQFSVFNYTKMANTFTGFSLTINPDAYNTDPALSDSDFDGLSDHAELITGYRVTLTDELSPSELIFTDPNKSDSDGDGISDYDEATGTYGYVTNANDADTDGDGTSDFTEIHNDLINPLQPDALVTVTYASLHLGSRENCSTSAGEEDCPEKTNYLWWLYGNGNDGVNRGNRILSSSDEFAYTPDATVRPIGTAHKRIVSESIVPDEYLPQSSTYEDGLKMEASYCPGNPETDYPDGNCTNFITIEAGDRGYNNNAHINWSNTSGVPAAKDRFVVKWSGEIYFPKGGEEVDSGETDDNGDPIMEFHPAIYKIYIKSDDGFKMALKDQTGVDFPGIDNEWSLNSNQNRDFEIEVDEAGWMPIEIEYFENEGYAKLLLEWQIPDEEEEFDPENPKFKNRAPVDVTYLRHSLGNGALSCIAVERDTAQTSFMSLNRSVDIDNSILPTSNYASGLSYYGSIIGSEMKIFKEVVASDIRGGHSRYYIDFEDEDAPRVYNPITGNKDKILTGKDLTSVLLDLAASRNIIDGLVEPTTSNTTIITEAKLIKDEVDDRQYFELSAQGKMLYQLLSQPDANYGQQQFVVKEGENINLSGVVMRIEDLDSLTACPVGSDGVVSQFASGCLKRFSRALSYAEITSQSYMSLNLNDLQATTSSTDSNPASCDIDISLLISH
ncbi:Ig-like domain-containing protein [Shewanella sp. A25]|nr:Ig-like domain-containing protein [Shewanella shenzhenensis]